MIKIIGMDKKSIKQAVALSERVFGSDFLRNNYMKEADFKPSNIRLLYEGDKLASMACVLPRMMYFDGIKVKLAGIGGVATAPEFRDRGYASILMKDTAAFMENERYALSLLYPYKKGFYERLGYCEILFPFRVLDIKDCRPPGPGYRIKTTLRPECPKIKKVYDTFCNDKTGPVARSASYWKINCRYWSSQANEHGSIYEPFFGAYKGKSLKAYVKISPVNIENHGGIKLSEFACLPGEEKALDGLVYESCVFALKNGFKKLFYDDAAGMEIGGSRAPLKKEYTGYCDDRYVKMYRICDFGLLMKSLNTLFLRRMHRGGLKIKEHVKIERQEKDFQGTISIKFSGKKNRNLMDDKLFLELLLGLKQPANNLKIFFPLLKPVFWDFDYF